jgi:hypothetical protein
VVSNVESHRQQEGTPRPRNRDRRSQVDDGVAQSRAVLGGQRIRNTNAARGVVISVQAKDTADPRGSLPGSR